MTSVPSWGPYGYFDVIGPTGASLKIVASGGDDPVSDGWEHVSVSTQHRCPNWIEMSFVKNLFWSDDETVIQFHPMRSEYVNNHPFVLHLWRHKTGHALPPSILVGMKDRGELTYREAMQLRRQFETAP